MKGPPISETLDEDEEILGSDDDEQEDPRDYTKGNIQSLPLCLAKFKLDGCYFCSSPGSIDTHEIRLC